MLRDYVRVDSECPAPENVCEKPRLYLGPHLTSPIPWNWFFRALGLAQGLL